MQSSTHFIEICLVAKGKAEEAEVKKKKYAIKLLAEIQIANSIALKFASYGINLL